MKVRIFAATSALVLGAMVGASAALGQSSQSMTDAEADAAIVAMYPAKAKAAGVEGSAVLVCGNTQHAALKDCVLSRETPAGYGFGDAALAIARMSRENMKVDWRSDRRDPVTFTFRLNPPAISPNTLSPPHMITSPEVVGQASIEEVLAAYPNRAMDRRVSGQAVLDCGVGLDGRLSACSVADERPGGYGFGKAALTLAPRYRLTPLLFDGEPQAGARLKVPFSFSLEK